MGIPLYGYHTRRWIGYLWQVIPTIYDVIFYILNVTLIK